MDKNEQWLKWAMELQSLAQAGLFYTEGVFDRERYERIREISAEMIAYKTEISLEKVKDIFCNEVGYQTPKLDIRTAVFKEDKILLVQESNGQWTLPGGWCDIDISVKESAIKEVKEEAGLDVEIDRVVAVQEQAKRNYPAFVHSICKVFVLGNVTGGHFTKNEETIDSKYFSIDELPELATHKATAEQIKMCFVAHQAENWDTIID